MKYLILLIALPIFFACKTPKDATTKKDQKSNEMTEITAKLGDIEIWVANRPYASGDIYKDGKLYGRPSRNTIYRLLKKFYELEKTLKDNHKEKEKKILNGILSKLKQNEKTI